MAAGIMDVVLVGVVLLAGVYVIKSGILNTITSPQQVQPVATAPVEGVPTTTTPTDGTGTTPTTTTPTTTTPTDPLQALIDQLLGTGGANTLPTQPGGVAQPPVQQPPIYQGNPSECKSRYNGKCDTECKSGNTSLCNACQMACGGATVGAVQTLPSQGGTNQSLCKSKFNGKCDTECKGGNSSNCTACKQACGSFGAYAYYIQTPQHPITASVFRNNNYSYNSNWQIGVQNAR